MARYHDASICLNGHVVDKYNSNVQKYCHECGKEVISICPSCETRIRGLVDLKGNFIGYIPYDPPSYCYNCSDPFPWIKKIIDNAVELIALDDNLSDEYKEIIKNALPDIIVETPTTPVAVAKYKKHMKSASGYIKDTMYNLLVDVLSDTVKTSIFD